ncbi:MAG: hypothetical protein KA988_02515 [Longilinea sp.]|nr:hypothetical protein [Longilinea sp.]MCA1954570.1 hypothetical protein [Anaerolinea sp.]
MKTIRAVRGLQRWRDVQAVLVRYGFDFLIDQEEIQEVRAWLRDHLHLPLGEFSGRSVAERLRLMLQDLGPTFVKLGQVMSSRSDLLPQDWVRELSKLQDEVAPFPFEQVKDIVERELGKPLSELFLSFEEQPLAAASLGQVHRAVLPNLNPVVVKVLRPGVEAQVSADMEILREIGRLVEGRTAWGRRYAIGSVIEEFARSLTLEMDYRNEGTNADRLRRGMKNQGRVHVPYIYWEMVTTRVLVMEQVDGVKIKDREQLDALGVDCVDLADVLVRSIFTQLLIEGFFHADPHPGNLMVERETHALVYIDLGMMGVLLPDQRQALGDVVQAILRHDSAEVVRLLLVIGTPTRPVQETLLQREVDRLIARYLEAELGQISFATLLSEVLALIYQHGIRLPSELSMAIKTLIQAEAVARELDARISVVEILTAVAQQMVLQRLNPQTWVFQLAGMLRETSRLTQALPRALEVLLTQMGQGALRIGLDIPDFAQQVCHLYTITNRLTVGVVLAGMIIGSAIAMGVSPHDSWSFIPILGVIGFVVSMSVAGFLVWGVFLDIWRSNRRSRRDS